MAGLWITGSALFVLGIAYAVWVGPYLHVIIVIAVGLWLLIAMWRVCRRVRASRSPYWVLSDASLELRDGADKTLKIYPWKSVANIQPLEGLIAKRFAYQTVEIRIETGETVMISPVGAMKLDDLISNIEIHRRNSRTGDML